MKKKLSRLIVCIVAMTMLLASMTVLASAKTIKPKYSAFTTDTATAAKKALTVKKGNYTVVVPKNEKFYLKFTAPKTKTYTFTISNVTPKAGKTFANGFAYIMNTDSYFTKYISSMKVKTQGGTYNTLWFASRSATTGDKVYRTLASRYGKVKLNAGQTVYLYVSTSSAKTINYKIK